MRVLVYTSIFPSARAPIRGVYNLYIARALARHAEVRVVCPVAWHHRLNAPSELFRRVDDRSTGLAVEYPTFWPVSRLAPKANPHCMQLATREAVERVRKDFRFDVILAMWGYPDAVAALEFARGYGCPLVVNPLGSDINILARNSKFRPLIAEALNASNSVVALSRAMADGIAELGVPSERIIVQYNGVNHDQFYVRDRARARGELGLPPDSPVVVYVGNLEHVKAPDVLIRAFSRLLEVTADEPLLVMVGAGSLLPSLTRIIREKGLVERVRLVGRKPHDAIPVWLAAADLLCVPSRMEGCPNVVIEAFASGRPVVATSVGGLPELVHEARGILVPRDDPDRLAVALAQALRRAWDPRAIARSAEVFTWEAFGLNLARVLEAAVAEGPREHTAAQARSSNIHDSTG
jgi:glycosyltransferase involved in cell wall biosynthesis